MPPRALTAALVVTLLATGAGADEKYAGRWKRTSLKLAVQIESWGEDCGPEPKSYGSNKEVETEIVSQGKHLVFTTGNLRTDRCMSPNPHLQSVSESSGGGSWKRVCQTPASESKSERVEYSLTASGTDRLNYRALSRFDWTLKGNKCVATLDETRVFVRVPDGESATGSGDKPAADKPAGGKPAAGKAATHDETADDGTECEAHGPARRLTIAPREARIGPGERVCFAAHGHDDKDCRFTVNAAWVATQDGQEVGGLLSRGGCFSAGANAAESEGEYEISARFDGKKATARVVVAFPDLGDLLAARLRPADGEEVVETPATAPGPVPIAPAALPVSPPAAGGGGALLLVAVIGGIALLAAGVLVVVIIIRKRSGRGDAAGDDDWDEPLPPHRGPLPRRELPSSSLAPEPAPPTPASETGALRCPQCQATFPAGAKFCPHDGATLAAVAAAGAEEAESPGMICPKCHRPYEPGARFCPHDKEKLMPYPLWRERQRGL